MNKQEKAREVESLRQALAGCPTAFVLAYRGLTVNQVSSLRKKVRATSSRYQVVKNRLALRALKETPLEGLVSHFKGPTAIAYGGRDPAALAKALGEFTRDNQGLQVKAGLVEGRVVTSKQIESLAALPAREVLVARLLSVMNGPAVRFVTVLKGSARALVRALDQIAAQKKGAPSGGQPAA